MPFTTLQDRALFIPRQKIGPQYERTKFQLGEIHTILPPIGHDSINCQGIDIPPEGKRLQITKEIVALIQAGFVRIAHDMTNPDADKLGGSLPSSPSDASGGEGPSHADTTVGVSSLDLGTGVVHAPSLFSSAAEIEACEDREKLRQYVEIETGFPNPKAAIEVLREVALREFNKHLVQ